VLHARSSQQTKAWQARVKAKKKTPSSAKASAGDGDSRSINAENKILGRDDARDALLSHTEGEWLLRRFIRIVDSGESPSATDLRRIAEAFKKILAGMPPRKAFAIERGKGRRAPTLKQLEPRIELTMEVLCLLPKAKSEREALRTVSKKRGVPISTLKGHLDKYRDIAQSLLLFEAQGKRIQERLPQMKRRFGDVFGGLPTGDFEMICEYLDSAQTPTELSGRERKIESILQSKRSKT
jgi:hypothetical protein